MRLLAVADTHGDSSLMKQLAERAVRENVDLVLLCGDITLFDDVRKDTIKPFITAGKRVLILPGNHEQPLTVDVLSGVYSVRNLHDSYAVYDNIAFIGNSSVNVGPHGVLSDTEVFASFKKNVEKSRGLKQVFVTHVHPSGTRADAMTLLQGSRALRKAIEEFQPSIVIHGHAHEAQGLEESIGLTRIVNVAKQARIIDV